MGEGKSGQKGESREDQPAAQDFAPVDRDSRSQADYGGSRQHRDENTSQTQGSEAAQKENLGESPSTEPDGPTTQHTGP